jgi:hypothetical protein
MSRGLIIGLMLTLQIQKCKRDFDAEVASYAAQGQLAGGGRDSPVFRQSTLLDLHFKRLRAFQEFGAAIERRLAMHEEWDVCFIALVAAM